MRRQPPAPPHRDPAFGPWTGGVWKWDKGHCVSNITHSLTHGACDTVQGPVGSLSQAFVSVISVSSFKGFFKCIFNIILLIYFFCAGSLWLCALFL